MNLDEIIVQGTLNPDGTLDLDQKPNLSPGRVTVVLRPVPGGVGRQEDWLQHLQRIRAEREAAGYPFMNEEEVAAYLEELRDGDDRIEEARRLAEQARKDEEQQG